MGLYVHYLSPFTWVSYKDRRTSAQSKNKTEPEPRKILSYCQILEKQTPLTDGRNLPALAFISIDMFKQHRYGKLLSSGQSIPAALGGRGVEKTYTRMLLMGM
jgi:hypothetical protein